jgi:hypothetical protein
VIRNHVYHPRFAGSFSLEGVLPALVPEMTYDDMEVADGTDAGLAWESLLRGGLDQVERERTRKALLDYCGQDTLAMVKLVGRLRQFRQNPIRKSFAGTSNQPDRSPVEQARRDREQDRRRPHPPAAVNLSFANRSNLLYGLPTHAKAHQ